jgi:hypothetical protein
MTLKTEYQGKKTIAGHILDLATREEGVHVDDLPQFNRECVIQTCSYLVVRGQIIRGGYRQWARYFTDMKCAEAYDQAIRQQFKDKRANRTNERAKARRKERMEAQGGPKKPGPKPKVEKVAKTTPWRQPKKALPPVVTIAQPKVPFKDQPAIVPKGLKVTKCPSPEHFGPAARLAYAPVQEAWQGKPLRVGEEV